jgi:hypothetical protein
MRTAAAATAAAVASSSPCASSVILPIGVLVLSFE